MKKTAKRSIDRTIKAKSPLSKKGADRAVIPAPEAGATPSVEGPPPMLNAMLVERLADLVVERVIAKLGAHPLHGEGPELEYPHLHQAQTGRLDIANIVPYIL